jgi:hypothetical protein
MRIAALAVEPFKVCGLVSDRRRALRPLEGDGSWGTRAHSVLAWWQSTSVCGKSFPLNRRDSSSAFDKA